MCSQRAEHPNGSLELFPIHRQAGNSVQRLADDVSWSSSIGTLAFALDEADSPMSSFYDFSDCV